MMTNGTERICLYNGDCIELMKCIPDKSVDMILTDLPYNITGYKYDKQKINLPVLWEQYERVITDKEAICLFGSSTFTFTLYNSNPSLYRYKWVWVKNKKSNFINSKNKPMSAYEEILVFSKEKTSNGCKVKMNYYPQGLVPCNSQRHSPLNPGVIRTAPSFDHHHITEFTNYPNDILDIKCPKDKERRHPSEKSIELLRYLIRTYTKEDEVVLDSCMGAGSCAVAAQIEGRRFIGMEINEEYFAEAKKRMDEFNFKIM